MKFEVTEDELVEVIRLAVKETIKALRPDKPKDTPRVAAMREQLQARIDAKAVVAKGRLN